MSLFALANSLSPLAIIGLLVAVVLMLVKGKEEVGGKVDLIGTNHLHDVGDKLDTIAETLQRMEVTNSESFAWIRAKLGNGSK